MTCPRSEEIDRLLGGSLEAAEAWALRDHVGGCAVCGEEEARARREKDMYVAELAPFRLSSDLSRRTLPGRRPSLRNLLPAAVILAAVGAGIWLVEPERRTPAAGDRLVSMEILRRDGKGGAAGEKQVLLEEELPFVQREFLEIGFLDRVELATNPPEPRRFPSLEVSVVRQKAGKVESWVVNVGSSAYVSYSLDGKPATSATLHEKQFKRLWAVLDRAANPLQIRLERGSDGGHRARLVYRGGVAAWKEEGDVALLLSTGGGVVAYRRVRVGEFGVRLPAPAGPFAAWVDLGKRLAAHPHDPSVSWGWGGAESAQVQAEEILGCRRAVIEILQAAADGKADAFAAMLWPIRERGEAEVRAAMEALRAEAGARIRMSGMTPQAVPAEVAAADGAVDAYFVVAFEKSWDRGGGPDAVTGFSYSVVRRGGRYLLVESPH